MQLLKLLKLLKFNQEPRDYISCGDVGYIISGIKNAKKEAELMVYKSKEEISRAAMEKNQQSPYEIDSIKKEKRKIQNFLPHRRLTSKEDALCSTQISEENNLEIADYSKIRQNRPNFNLESSM